MVNARCTICKIRRCEEQVHFFTVPTNDGRRQRWKQACGKELKETDKICSKHFLEKDFIEPPGSIKRARLYPNAVPKVFLSGPIKCKPKILILSPQKTDPTVSQLLSTRKSLSVSVTHVAKTKTQQTPIEPKIHCSSELKQVQLCSHDLVQASVNKANNTGLSRGYRLNGTVNMNGKVCFDSISQTDDDYLKSYALLENMDLKKKVKKLESEIEKLKQEVQVSQCIMQNLGDIFTEGQLRRLRSRDRFIHWCRTDITSATNLHAAGHNAYMYLYKQGFPLPSIATLKKWAQRKRKLEKELHQMSTDVMSDDFIEEQEEEQDEEEKQEEQEIIQSLKETKKEQQQLSVSADNIKPTHDKSDKLKMLLNFVENKNAISNDKESIDQPYKKIKIEEAVLSSECPSQSRACIPISMNVTETKEDLSDDEKISVQSFDELKRDEVLSYDKIKVKDETNILFLDDIDEFLLA